MSGVNLVLNQLFVEPYWCPRCLAKARPKCLLSQAYYLALDLSTKPHAAALCLLHAWSYFELTAPQAYDNAVLEPCEGALYFAPDCAYMCMCQVALLCTVLLRSRSDSACFDPIPRHAISLEHTALVSMETLDRDNVCWSCLSSWYHSPMLSTATSPLVHWTVYYI